MFYVEDDELYHIGVKYRSGRYPYGSGDTPFQHDGTASGFLSSVSALRSMGMSETEIAEGFGISTTALRQYKTLAKSEVTGDNRLKAIQLKEEGYSNVKIGEMLGMPESSVRNLLKEEAEKRATRVDNTVDVLKKELESKSMLDVGLGVDLSMGVSETTFKAALKQLEEEGYTVETINVPQPNNPDKMTTIKVLAAPGTTKREIWANREDISTVQDYLVDGGDSIKAFKDPTSLSSSRVYIRYAEDGGLERDGTIELRRGVDDLSLGASSYAQVRIGVDGTHYMKGMAYYSDDIPDGYDVVYNTNKKSGTDPSKVFKAMEVDKNTGEIDKSNPFKAVIKANGQYEYTDADGNKKLSPINKLKEEGDWSEYAKSVSAQLLSKQPMKLINRQLDISMKEQQDELDEICSLTNNAVKKKLLQSYADECDKKASDLKAAAFPRQSTQVILPVTGMKDDEIYAPNYKDGESVALIRYPHAGTFEIPILKVNNKSSAGRSVVGEHAKDAVGITKAVADRLSGADFDGDTVVVIPTGSNGVKINSTKALSGLKDFDTKAAYPYREGMTVMSKKNLQNEMGKVSNLITDMTLKGATASELTRAVKHSMVVIDSYKHKLDYKKSEEDNGIAELKTLYQGGANRGASTLISLAGSDKYINQRTVDKKKGVNGIDPDTGEVYYKETGATTRTGKLKTQTVTKMSLTKDAHTLSSGTPQEEAYATYANKMKSLANQARKELVATPNVKRDPEAAKTYATEVASLKSKLNNALMNAPRERQAQLIANTVISAQKEANPELYLKENKDDLKKISTKAIANARAQTGAKRAPVPISDKEWEAIQAGAVSQTTLSSILQNTDLDSVKQRSMPRSSTTALSSAKQARLKSLYAQGKTASEIADALGVSTSTVYSVVEGTSS